MPIKIINKRITKRGKEIRDFIKYLTLTQKIDHEINLHILDFPCVYNTFNDPAFALFYIDENENIRIEIANDIEWYEKIYQQKFGIKFCLYFVLSSLAHEIQHYFQYRDDKKLIENWVEYKASKMMIDYISWKKGKIPISIKYVEIMNKANKLESKNDSKIEYFEAIDPINFIRKKVKLKPLIS